MNRGLSRVPARGIHRLPCPSQGGATGGKYQRIEQSPLRRHGTMPGLVALEQHGPVGQVQAPGAESRAQGMIGPTVAQLQLRQAPRQLAAQDELPAEGATALVLA
jgi:hypothetical protein